MIQELLLIVSGLYAADSFEGLFVYIYSFLYNDELV